MITQALKKAPAAASRPQAAPKLSAEAKKAVESAKSSLASQKGYPWSQTEYHCALASMMDHLSSQYGEAAGQALLNAMASVPVRGGRFNSWSGD